MAHRVDPEARPRSDGDRSLGELFSDLTRDTSELLREEVALAKAELSQKAAHIGKDLGFLAAGGAVAYAGFLALVAALIIGLGQLGLTWWLSALIVGLLVAGLGAYLVFQGLENLKHEELAPQQTIQTLKEDAEWAKAQTK
jgi:hypothetical protein